MQCERCSGRNYLMVPSVAEKCGHNVQAAPLEYCHDCSERLKVCMGCGKKMPEKGKS